MQISYRKREQGFSLIVALLALMLLSAIAVGMMFISSTESAVASNFKSEEAAYFAARAGIEEVRDRMLPSPPSPGGNYSVYNLLPTATVPGPGFALYVLNGTTMATVTDLSNPSNLLADDELCHDYYVGGGMTWQPANVRCGSGGLPTGGAWYTSTNSLTPIANTNPLDYRWVRITLKANDSYGGMDTTRYVDPGQAGSSQVCWNGSGLGAYQIVTPTNCSDVHASPVYLLTALARTSNGSRRMIQEEVAQTYQQYTLPAGLFAVGTTCPSLILGGGAQTFSFDSSAENPPTTPPGNIQASGGNAGTNGNVYLNGSSVTVNGTIYTNQSPMPTVGGAGTCPTNSITKSGSPAYDGIGYAPAYVPAIPPLPNPLPPNGACGRRNPANCPTWNSGTISAGSYGNVTVQGRVTLQGGPDVNHPTIFTLNSLTLDASAELTINGFVVVNLAGVNLSAGGRSDVLKMNGNSDFVDNGVPAAFVVNYGGSAPMELNGGSTEYASINAPNSNLKFQGGQNFYGQIIAKTIDDQGGTNFYWDRALQTPPPANTSTFTEISLRELAY
jgi:type II secretory pathway pseudopilin PulG